MLPSESWRRFGKGHHPDASLNIWMGLYAPAKTPKPVQDTIARALAQAASDPGVVAAIEPAGMHVDYKDPAETLRALEAEATTVARVVEKLNLAK